MKSDPGTYLMILRADSERSARIGRWGRVRIVPGYYLYVGSALGPGGVGARVSRHFRRRKPSHWHIDYLRPLLRPLDAWCSFGNERLEHRWAESLSGSGSVSSIEGFGCSDCGCHSHLFYTSKEPDRTLISRIVGSEMASWWE